MKRPLLREITPLTQHDCFTIFSRVKSSFDIPLHYHEEFELNFIQGARGVRRVVGDHMETISDLELVLIGPNVPHGWKTHQGAGKEAVEITVQFHRDLFDEQLLQRNQLHHIRQMFNLSLQGIAFSRQTIELLVPRLKGLIQKSGFGSVLELMAILHELSLSRQIRTLADVSFHKNETVTYNSRRIGQVMAHLNNHFGNEITLAEAARLVSMSEAAFSRFFRMRTGKTFIETLNEIRLGQASRLLIETTQSVNEIAYKCGFNNISNFNRIFKKKKECTPREFRETYNASGIRTFI